MIIPPAPTLLDQISREAHLKRITYLKRAYKLDWLVEQETFNVANVYALEDCDLIRLLNFMERARECIAEDISFEDAGLVRSLRSGRGAERDKVAACDRDVNAERMADQAAIVGASKLRRSIEPDPDTGPPF